jgi:hypothetical protein
MVFLVGGCSMEILKLNKKEIAAVFGGVDQNIIGVGFFTFLGGSSVALYLFSKNVESHINCQICTFITAVTIGSTFIGAVIGAYRDKQKRILCLEKLNSISAEEKDKEL